MDKKTNITIKKNCTDSVGGYRQLPHFLPTFTSAQCVQRPNISRQGENCMCSRIKLLFLSCCHRCMSQLVHFRQWLAHPKFKFSYYITGFFILLGVLLGAIYLRISCVRSDGSRICCIKSPAKKFSTARAEASEIPEIYHSYGFRHPFANAWSRIR